MASIALVAGKSECKTTAKQADSEAGMCQGSKPACGDDFSFPLRRQSFSCQTLAGMEKISIVVCNLNTMYDVDKVFRILIVKETF